MKKSIPIIREWESILYNRGEEYVADVSALHSFVACAGDIFWVAISSSGGRGLVFGRRNEEVRGRKRLCH